MQLILLAMEDITERKRAGERERVLTAELRHRVKNMLAIVQSLFVQTTLYTRIPQMDRVDRPERPGNAGETADSSFHPSRPPGFGRLVQRERLTMLRESVHGAGITPTHLGNPGYSPSVERLRDTFLGRLHALARTHDHLMRREWRGMDLRELVEHELAPYRRALLLDFYGPRVRLGERESTALTMTLHELATNAAKYGALSVPQGRVSVRWETTDGEAGRWVHLRWRERDGPPVRTPSNRGFGTSLIERNITYELGGEAGLTFAAAGLECDLRFPLDG